MRNLQVNAELSYSHDDWEYQENFNNDDGILIYTDYNQLSGDYDLMQDVIIEDTRYNRIRIKKYLWKEDYAYPSELFGTVEELSEYLYQPDAEDLRNILDELKIEYTSNYEVFVSRGYSQGDYAEIYVNTGEYEKLLGVPLDKWKDAKTYFNHTLWDSPIFGEIEISFDYTTSDGVNLSYDDVFIFQEWAADTYEADTLEVDKIIATISQELDSRKTAIDFEELEKKLKDIDYGDVSYPRCGC